MAHRWFFYIQQDKQYFFFRKKTPTLDDMQHIKKSISRKYLTITFSVKGAIDIL